MAILHDTILDYGGAVYNVKNNAFGTAGNGNPQQDTTALKNALQTAGANGTVLFPPGVYTITEPLSLGTDQRIVGSGFASRIKFAPSVAGALFSTNPNSERGNRSAHGE